MITNWDFNLYLNIFILWRQTKIEKQNFRVGNLIYFSSKLHISSLRTSLSRNYVIKVLKACQYAVIASLKTIRTIISKYEFHQLLLIHPRRKKKRRKIYSSRKCFIWKLFFDFLVLLKSCFFIHFCLHWTWNLISFQYEQTFLWFLLKAEICLLGIFLDLLTLILWTEVESFFSQNGYKNLQRFNIKNIIIKWG
jgi:hypothetical protein